MKKYQTVMATSCLFGVSCSAACDLIRATCVCRHEFATFSMVSFVQFGCCDVSTASNYPPLTRIYLSIRFFFYSSHSSYFLSPHYWPIPPVIYFSKTDGRTCSTVRVSDWCGRSAEVKAHPETDKLNCSFCSCVLLTRHWHGAEGSRAHSFMHNAYVY